MRTLFLFIICCFLSGCVAQHEVVYSGPPIYYVDPFPHYYGPMCYPRPMHIPPPKIAPPSIALRPRVVPGRPMAPDNNRHLK